MKKVLLGGELGYFLYLPEKSNVLYNSIGIGYAYLGYTPAADAQLFWKDKYLEQHTYAKTKENRDKYAPENLIILSIKSYQAPNGKIYNYKLASSTDVVSIKQEDYLRFSALQNKKRKNKDLDAKSDVYYLNGSLLLEQFKELQNSKRRNS